MAFDRVGAVAGIFYYCTRRRSRRSNNVSDVSAVADPLNGSLAEEEAIVTPLPFPTSFLPPLAI